MTGDALELSAINDGESAAANSGIAHAEALIALADAQVGDDDAALAAARARLLAQVGPEAFVDATAVVANFERMVRVADSTGTPLDAPVAMISTTLRAELDLNRFGSAENTPPAGILQRALGRLLGPFTGTMMQRMGRRMAGPIEREPGASG